MSRVPVSALAPHVERYLVEQGFAPGEAGRVDALAALARRMGSRATSEASAESWIRRILASKDVDLDLADKLVAAIDATYLWHEDLAVYLPPTETVDFDPDRQCAECQGELDKDAVRVELTDWPRNARGWFQWWHLCSACATGLPVHPRRAYPTIAQGRKSNGGRLTDAQWKAAYTLYEHQRDNEGRPLGLLKLARLLIAQGYEASSERSLAHTLHEGFVARGWKLRDRATATRAASYKHGRANKHGKRPPGYKRFLRESRGEQVGVLCEGTTKRGKPCPRVRKNGSSYCAVHGENLDRAQKIGRALAAKSTVHAGEIDSKPLAVELQAFATWYGRGAQERLAERTGFAPTVVGRHLHGRFQTVKPSTVRRYRRAMQALAEPRSGDVASSPPPDRVHLSV